VRGAAQARGEGDGTRVRSMCNLMVQPVDALAQAFAGRRCPHRISFHPRGEPRTWTARSSDTRRRLQRGLVFNPAASLDELEWTIDQIDLLLVMSVNPGFGGQSFIPGAERRSSAVRKIIDASGRDIDSEVDGGHQPDNVPRRGRCRRGHLVAGSAIFGRRLQGGDRRDEGPAGRLTDDHIDSSLAPPVRRGPPRRSRDRPGIAVGAPL